jgi:hypothetical protein
VTVKTDLELLLLICSKLNFEQSFDLNTFASNVWD